MKINNFVPSTLKKKLLLFPDNPIFMDVREGTVLFSDISGFTSLTEKLMMSGREGSEELTFLINNYFDRMINIVYSYEGDIIKFGGDALLCYFDGTASSSNALSSVKEMMNVVKKEYKNISTSAGKFTITMHCGLEQGEIYECAVGDRDRQMEYLIFGSPVSEAFQLADLVSHNETGVSFNLEKTVSRFAAIEHKGEKRFFRLKDYHYKSCKKNETVPEQNNEEASLNMQKFVPSSLRDYAHQSHYAGEHRKVAVCFIEMASALNILIHARQVLANREKAFHYCANKLSHIYAEINKITQSYEGTFLKTDMSAAGEKIVLLFGAPVAHEDDSHRGLEALRRLLSSLRQTDGLIRKELGCEESIFQIRCSMTAGSVFWTLVGNELRKEWTVMGDSVNLSARLMSISQPWSITLEESLVKRLPHYEWDSLGQFTIKGKQRSLNIYKFKGEHYLLQRISSDEVQIIGREKELKSLESYLAQAAEGTKILVSLSGDAGLGKTQICTYLIAKSKIKKFNSFLISNQAYEMGEPYHAWKETLQHVFEFYGIDINNTRQLLGFLSHRLKEHKKWIPLFKDIFNLNIRENEWTEFLEPKIRKTKLFEIINKLLTGISVEQPLLIIFDDAHWMDSVSLELIEYLFKAPGNARYMIMIAHRTDLDIRRFSLLKSFKHIELKEFSDEQSFKLMDSMVGGKEKLQEFKHIINQKAQGNPLFIKLLIENLGTDAATSMKEVTVPDTISSMFLSIIDRLGDDEKLYVKLASIFGKSFSSADLQNIFSLEFQNHNFDQALSNLIHNNWIAEDKKNHYSFRYPLMQEVAYENVPYSFKRQCHSTIADNYEQKTGDLHQILEILAYHYFRSSNADKAIEYSLKAAEKSFNLYILPQSHKYFSEASELIERIKLKRYSEYFYDTLPPSVKLKIYEYQAFSHWNDVLAEMGRMKQAIEICHKALQCGKNIANEHELITLKLRLAHCHQVIGQLKTAFIIASRTLQKAKKLANNYGIGGSLNILANIMYLQNNHHSGLKYGKDAIHYAKKAKLPRQLGNTYSNLSNLYAAINKISTAIHYAKKALRIRAKINDKYGVSISYNNLGVFYHVHGKFKDALFYYKKSLAICKELDDLYGIAYSHRNIGEILFEKNRLNDSIKNFEKAHIYAVESGDNILETSVNLFLAAIFSRKKDYKSCMQYFNNAKENAEKMGLKDELLISHYWMSRYLHSIGKTNQSIYHLTQAQTYLSQMETSALYYKIYAPRMRG